MSIKKMLLLYGFLGSILLLVVCRGTAKITPESVTLKDIDFPVGCKSVLLKIMITQGDKIFTAQENLMGYSIEIKEFGGPTSAEDIDFNKRLKLRIEVVGFVGSCDPPFSIGKSWEFDGEMIDEGDGTFSVPFSEFK